MDNLRFGILTISDRSARGERLDTSGPILEGQVQSQGWTVSRTAIIPDDLRMIQETLSEWADTGEIDVILTTGGTGFSPRDVTPEATRAVLTREAPGLAEAMRSESLKQTPHGMLSRGVTGIRGRVLILNLPGSPKAAQENFEVVIPVLAHAVQLLNQDPGAEQGHSFRS